MQHLLTCPGSVHLRVIEEEGQYDQDQDQDHEGEDEDCIEDQVDEDDEDANEVGEDDEDGHLLDRHQLLNIDRRARLL